jgi:hypothetical protein
MATMDKYYYLVSLLPTLVFDKSPEISFDYFMTEAEKWTSPRDLSILSNLDIRDVTDKQSDTRVLREYKQLETAVRSDLAEWRKQKQNGKEYKPSAFPASLISDVNPLQAERNLLQLRWDFLSEKEREHHFDLDSLILYNLKLQIQRRLMSFDKEKGMETYKTMYKVSI